MSKQKTVWSCIDCGHMQPKWSGQCPSCSRWNVFHQEVEHSQVEARFKPSSSKITKPVLLNEVKSDESIRRQSKSPAFDRLLGGGLVCGSLILLGGDPGVGKSTLLLQVTSQYAQNGLKVLYICGEESIEQVSLRAKRLNLQAEGLFLLAETNLSVVKQHIEKMKPDLVIVDSVQVVYKSELPSLPGSVTQVREVTIELMYLAKSLEISIFLIGHVTKSGEIAGPRILEHLVDTVLYFEGDKQYHYRILRSVKNRFGSCDEIAIFQMNPQGLEEVDNPSEMFLDERNSQMHGSAIVPTIEGSCPILVEAQALVTPLAYSAPTRKCMGIDPNRLALLLAVLDKKMGYSLQRYDVFVALAGGIRIQEPALDLGVLMAITSSYREKKIDSHQVIIGEVGLGGNIRRVARIEKRLNEARRMGFTSCIIPKGNFKDLPQDILHSMQVHAIDFVNEAIEKCFGRE
ncbi:MAG: DNA repair protein RadA [Chlamydiae bacterium]|nr:DNA repair protein RadA [Chlamydiota bacterium]